MTKAYKEEILSASGIEWSVVIVSGGSVVTIRADNEHSCNVLLDALFRYGHVETITLAEYAA